MARAASSKKPEAAQPTSIFGAAPVVAPTPAAAKNKAVTKVVKGLEKVASLKGVIAALEAVLAAEMAGVKELMTTEFVTEGLALKRQPENFKGTDGFGSASCQLRASSSALTEETIALCKLHGIDTDTDVKVAETFVFAPAYASDSDFVRKMETLLGPQLFELQDVRGPIIQKQVGVNKVTVSDIGRNTIFTKDEEVVREFLPVAFTLAVRAKLETNGDLKPAIKVVEDLLGSPLWKDVATEAAADPEKLTKKVKESGTPKKKAA